MYKNNTLSFWLAWKYLRFGKKDKNISFMIKICFLGIFIGTFALMLTLIITNGFEKVIHEKMQGITSQALIYVPGKKLDDVNIKKVLAHNFADKIAAASSNSSGQVILDQNKRNDSAYGQQSVLFLKGIEPATEGLVSSIGEKIVFPVGATKENMLQKILEPNDEPNNYIIIGYKLARQYNLSVGGVVTLLVPEPGSRKKIYLNKKKATVKGIFKVGLDEYDSKLAYCSLSFFRSIFGEKEKKGQPIGVDQIALTFKKEPPAPLWKKIIDLFSFKESREQKILTALKNGLPGLTISSWKELYPALVSSLRLEKYVMFFVLALITLVACMNMISLLFMQIQQKRRDTAILKSMGAAHATIRTLFLSIGLSITFFASTLGLACAAIAGHFIEKYPFIKLPDVYYVSHLPARMDPEIFVVVFLSTMILGFLATWIPTKRAKKINVVDVLRSE